MTIMMSLQVRSSDSLDSTMLPVGGGVDVANLLNSRSKTKWLEDNDGDDESSPLVDSFPIDGGGGENGDDPDDDDDDTDDASISSRNCRKMASLIRHTRWATA